VQIGSTLFADDAAGIRHNLVEVEKFCDGVTRWSCRNEMSVGIGKCGLMEFLPEDLDLNAPPRVDFQPIWEYEDLGQMRGRTCPLRGHKMNLALNDCRKLGAVEEACKNFACTFGPRTVHPPKSVDILEKGGRYRTMGLPLMLGWDNPPWEGCLTPVLCVWGSTR